MDERDAAVTGGSEASIRYIVWSTASERGGIEPNRKEIPMVTETDITEDLVELVEFTTSALLRYFS